jgi:ABC-2 type transport system ATP-binding protein
MATVIEAQQLSKRYGRVLGLDSCDLSVAEGSFTALVGANGAGKTTLLLMLVGLLKPTSGQLLVLGLTPHEQRRETLATIGFVSQERPLYRSLSVRDTLEMGRRLNSRWDGRVAKERLTRLRIPLDRQVGKLSGGQQAQVSLSLALGKCPSVLILDEPMASLDPVARQLFMDEVATVASDRRMTVIMSSHIITDLSRVCDHVLILHGGRIKAWGTTADVIRSWSERGETEPRRNLTELEEAVLGYLGEEDGGSDGLAPV